MNPLFKTAAVSAGLFVIVFGAIYFTVPNAGIDCSKYGVAYSDYLSKMKESMPNTDLKDSLLEKYQDDYLLNKWEFMTPDNIRITPDSNVVSSVLGTTSYPDTIILVRRDQGGMICSITQAATTDFMKDMQELEESKK